MEGTDIQEWDELTPDTLMLIFKNLSLYELLIVVPAVCKSWRKVTMGPYCWQEIDLKEWGKNFWPESVDKMLRLLITRSSGSLRKFCVDKAVGDQSVLFLANHAPFLQTLELRMSIVTDSTMGTVATMLPSLTFLDLSHCTNVGAGALAIIGKHCKSLTTFRRIMNIWMMECDNSQNEEALAIASTMTKLKHLDIGYLMADNFGIIEIIKNCTDLVLLEIKGCRRVCLDDEFIQQFPKLKVVGNGFGKIWSAFAGREWILEVLYPDSD